MQRKQILRRFGFILALALISLVFSLPNDSWGDGAWGQKMQSFKVTLGLDLAGGTELDYKIDLSEAIAQNADDDSQNDVDLEIIAESVRDALERRVNPAGVGEITVKRSQVASEEHVLIQMPPSSNVLKAKKDAERDNRLAFYEEDPSLESSARVDIAAALAQTDGLNWSAQVSALTASAGVSHEVIEPAFTDQLPDQNIVEILKNTPVGYVVEEVMETQTELEATVGDDGNLQIKSFSQPVFAIIKVTDKTEETREKSNPPMAKARHILFGYEGALRAPEDAYATKEEAQGAAQDMLVQLQEEGTENFADLAKEFSTEGAAQESGGDLGEFGPGQMVKPFSDAVFTSEEAGLLAEVIETDFGFHVIEVLELKEEFIETTQETKIGYEMIAWYKSELGWKLTDLGGGQLDNASVGWDQVGQPIVNLRFNPEGGDMFAAITGRVSTRRCADRPCRLGVKVGGDWITQPTVQQKIIGRDAQITGQFSFEEAEELANGLNLGAIDAPVTLSGQLTIQAELGQAQLKESLHAAILGILGIMVFMVLVYRLAGVIASVSLALYAGMFITILKVWSESFGGPIVLSLAGAAGIALSIGLAVDGNILIFERFKEEIRRGRGMTKALDLGFDRAWTAIRDSNLTTLLTCFILFIFGNALMKGFAITLIVGTLLSMFTAVTISYNLLRFALLFDKCRKASLFGVSETSEKKGSVGAKIRKRK